jgi:hypothetical protein
MPKKIPESGEPKFPYTTEPKALRRLLTEIPKRPKPPKLTMETLKSWAVSNNNNARTAINVLKKLGLVSDAGEPTNLYIDFMKTGSGPGVLAERIKETYKVLFDNSHAPQSETDEELKKLFHIHTGGGVDAMRLQIQTFKALTEYANFAITGITGESQEGRSHVEAGDASSDSRKHESQLPPIRIDLHIHLPENKTTRDYEAIIQDIAKYIYGRNIERS